MKELEERTIQKLMLALNDVNINIDLVSCLADLLHIILTNKTTFHAEMKG